MSPNDRKRNAGGSRLQRPAENTEKPAQKRSAEGRKPKQQRTQKQKTLRVLYIILTVVAALIVVGFIAYRLLVVKPELPGGGVEKPGSVTGGEVVQPTEGPKTSGDRKEDFYTFMLVGRDTYGGGNTDTIMVLAYDIPNQQLNVMSIPRDTMVNVPWDIKRINSVYNYATYYDKEGMEFLKEEVSALIGFQPDYTITVEWEAVGEIVDAIGGVWFEVPFNMYYNDLSQNFKVDLKKGYQLIDGSKAMQLLRYRHNSVGDTGKIDYSYGYANGDLGRIKTQQAFLKSTIKQCLANITDVKTISNLAKVFAENVTLGENLTVNNLAWFGQEAILGGLKMENVNFMTLPNKGASVYSRTYGNYQSYVTPIPDEMLEMVNTYFNPYLEDVELNELDLMIVNSDGSLSSTTGYVADSKATAPPKKGSSTSTTPTDNPAPAVPEEPEDPEDPVEEPVPGTEPGSGGEVPAEPTPSPGTDPGGTEPGGTETEPPAEPSPSPSEPPASEEPPAQSAEPTPSPEPTSGPGMAPAE